MGGSASKHHRTASRRVLTFDPASEAYEAVTDIPECIVDFGVVVVGSVMYLVGGYTGWSICILHRKKKYSSLCLTV